MGMKAVRGVAATILAGVALVAASEATAKADKPYARMAPIDAYMMDRAAEITLAKSAAPEAISKNATVLVLTRAGYQTAITGTNGFVCLVERGFSGAPDWGERWNPKILAPGCLNPQAVRAILPIDVMRTNMTVAGKSDAEILDSIKSALSTGKIPALGAGALCYMMSNTAYLSEMGDHRMAHVMFYVPVRDGTDWAANLPKSPVMGGNYWFFTPERKADADAMPPISVFLIGTTSWADGTPVAMGKM